MSKAKFALLEFNPTLNAIGDNKKLNEGLSAVVKIGNELWVANDESTSLERLSCLPGEHSKDQFYCDHEHFVLSDYISLPGGEQREIDIEGLDWRNGYLWLIGSHSLSRKKAQRDEPDKKNFNRLAKISEPAQNPNRYVLARIPLKEKNGVPTPEKHVEENGTTRTAAQLGFTFAGNELMTALAEDAHLKPFFAIPGKDNGFDIEGLAVTNDNRVFIGLRGPVLRGWSIILELRVEAGNNNSPVLQIKNFDQGDPGSVLYRKHFLELGGLGIRDLCADGSDLLVLSGPSMNLDGPVSVFRWKNGLEKKEESLVWQDDDSLQKIKDIPFGNGDDHAEGMTAFSKDNGRISSLLVVHDAASKQRQKEPSGLVADIFHFDY